MNLSLCGITSTVCRLSQCWDGWDFCLISGLVYVGSLKLDTELDTSLDANVPSQFNAFRGSCCWNCSALNPEKRRAVQSVQPFSQGMSQHGDVLQSFVSPSILFIPQRLLPVSCSGPPITPRVTRLRASHVSSLAFSSPRTSNVALKSILLGGAPANRGAECRRSLLGM